MFKFYNMKLSIVLSIVFVLHIHWVCADSNATTISPQTAVNSSVMVNETSTKTPVTLNNDSKNITVKPAMVMNQLLQQTDLAQQQQEQSQEQSDEQNSNEVSFQAIFYQLHNISWEQAIAIVIDIRIE